MTTSCVAILPPSQKNSPEVHFAWLRPRCQPWGFWEGHPTKKPSETVVVGGVQCAMLSWWCINGSLSFSNTPSAAGVSIIFHQFTMFTCSMSWLGVSHDAPKTKFTKNKLFFIFFSLCSCQKYPMSPTFFPLCNFNPRHVLLHPVDLQNHITFPQLLRRGSVPLPHHTTFADRRHA